MKEINDAYLVQHFPEALQNGSIQAYFQPIYRSFTGKIFCAEALARWFLPDGEVLSPEIFIPALEQGGLIFDLDMEILRQTCELYVDLKQRGTPVNSFSVNLSRHDFENEDLFERVVGILEQYEVPTEAIKLEITESVFMENVENFESVFGKFRSAGFSVWIDDFGSGYSSLNMLQNYSFDVIKFDMFFLKDLAFKGRELLASLISMAKILGIHTLMEGIETEEHRDFLLALGCEAQQGFYYSKPVSTDTLKAMFSEDPDLLEKPEDKTYWDQIGRLNLLSVSPLKEFAEGRTSDTSPDDPFGSYDNSIALLECSQNDFRYVFATNGYRKSVRELGFDSVSGLEQALSNQRSYHHLMIRKLILETIQKRTVQTMEYVNKGVYYRLSMQLIARKQGWVMLALQLNTFDSEQEVKTAKEMLSYGSALFSTYELVVLFLPERKAVTRIYVSHDMPTYDQEATLEESLLKFCKAEIAPVDQERYLKFLDFQTMGERIDATPKKFIQALFRTQWGKEIDGSWHTARVTEVSTLAEKAYLLTFQSLQGEAQSVLKVFSEEHPEYLS